MNYELEAPRYGRGTLQNQTLDRPNRFAALAETSFKSPLDMKLSAESKSPNEGGS